MNSLCDVFICEKKLLLNYQDHGKVRRTNIMVTGKVAHCSNSCSASFWRAPEDVRGSRLLIEPRRRAVLRDVKKGWLRWWLFVAGLNSGVWTQHAAGRQS